MRFFENERQKLGEERCEALRELESGVGQDLESPSCGQATKLG